MAEVHPTAIIQGDVSLDDDVTIGPGCVLDGTLGPVEIGPGTRLIGRSFLTGPLTLGARSLVYPFACLGFAPQDLNWDPQRPGAGLVIGESNTIRESATIHRATSDETPTTIGDRNYWMAASHAGHDCQVGSDCTFANAVALGGHAVVEDRVIIGGGTVVHQFCRLGRGAMLSGGVAAPSDLPPFFMLTGINVAGSINLVGLRRSGASSEMIEDVKWVYRTLYRRGLSVKRATEVLRERADNLVVAEYLRFIAMSKRGLCRGRPSAARGTVERSIP